VVRTSVYLSPITSVPLSFVPLTQVLLRPTVAEAEGEGDADDESNSDTDDDMPLLDRQLGAIADCLKAANTRPPPPRPRPRSRGGMGGPDGGGRRRTGRSMYRGVSWNSAAGKWRSHVGHEVRLPVVLRCSSNMEPQHVHQKGGGESRETCSKAPVCLARSRALKQGTWCPCLTTTVIGLDWAAERQRP